MRDISILSPDLLLVGRQVETDFGGVIDLLCVEASGDLVIIELKRKKTPREVTAQVLDYASWVAGLPSERVIELADRHLAAEGPLEHAFIRKFGEELPDTLNGDHRMVIVASEIDESSERIIRYLSEEHGVSINAATFNYFRSADGAELLARVFLLEPSEVEYQSTTKGGSKRRPNLTYGRLQEIAENNGAGDLYSKLVEGLTPSFGRHTTRSSIVFTGNLEGSRKAILSLIPAESSAEKGLRFQMYENRACELFNVSKDEIASLLPQDQEPWQYHGGAGPDWTGFAGFFVSAGEAERFLAGIAGFASP